MITSDRAEYLLSICEEHRLPSPTVHKTSDPNYRYLYWEKLSINASTYKGAIHLLRFMYYERQAGALGFDEMPRTEREANAEWVRQQKATPLFPNP